MALAAARRTLPPQRIDHLAGALADLPARIGAVLERAAGYCAVARRFAGVRDFFFLGRGAGHAVALEGALKPKEIAYVRAEAYAAGEMKHGPIALVEPGVVVVGVAGTGLLRDKMLSNIAEMQARGATIVLVAADGDREAAEAADALLPVPDALRERSTCHRPSTWSRSSSSPTPWRRPGAATWTSPATWRRR